MPPLPKAICPDCHKVVAVRKNGELREHHVYRPQLEQEPEKHMGRLKKCPGSGTAVRERDLVPF